MKSAPDDEQDSVLLHWPLEVKVKQQSLEDVPVHLISPVLQALLHATWDNNKSIVIIFMN